MAGYYPVTVQQLNADTEVWAPVMQIHAIKVNKTGGGESFNAGADQFHPTLTFTFRWTSAIEAIAYNTQQHRLVYRGHTFNIVDYDDYMERHLTVDIVGAAYG